MKFRFETSSEKKKSDEKLTVPEAFAYQTYAAEKSGVGFSEKADDESYEEAEALLQRLESAGVKLEGIDFEKINLKNVIEVDELGERLEKAVLAFEDAKKDEKVFGEIGKASKCSGLKRVIILLNVFSILSGGIVAHAAGDDWKKFVPKSSSFSEQSDNNRSEIRMGHEHMKKFQMGNTEVTFTYDAQGRPILYESNTRMQLDKQMIENLEVVIDRMLIDDVDNVLKKASFPGHKNVRLDVAKRNLKNSCRRLIEKIGVYKQLLKMGNNKEAKFLLKSMSDSIERQENSIGVRVFNIEFINKALNSQD